MSRVTAVSMGVKANVKETAEASIRCFRNEDNHRQCAYRMAVKNRE
jgi:hypothetical protein